MRMCSKWLLVMMGVTIPLTGFGCEPILPLAQLLGGGTLGGPLSLTRSFLWLAVAVLIKCVAFIILEKRLPWRRGVGYMVLANVLSTIPGWLVAGLVASPSAFFLALPIIYILGNLLERRLSLIDEPSLKKRISGGRATVAFFGFFIISVATFELAGLALEGRNLASYWLLKFLFVMMTAATGILISTVLEEGVVARLSRKKYGNVSFYTSVWRANYITLGFILLVVALQMLPKRLGAPGFIVSWLHSVSAVLGMT